MSNEIQQSELPENPTPQDYGFPERPTSSQVTRWANQQRFLAAYSRIGNIAAAAKEAGVVTATVYNWESLDDWSFTKRMQDAGKQYLGVLESEIHRRAVEGVDKPIIHKGVITGTYKEYSDNLLMFRTKRLDPAYRDNYVTPQQTLDSAKSLIDALRLAAKPEPPAISKPESTIEAEVKELDSES